MESNLNTFVVVFMTRDGTKKQSDREFELMQDAVKHGNEEVAKNADFVSFSWLKKS